MNSSNDIETRLNEALNQLSEISSENEKLKGLIHDLVSPLQIISMSIETMLNQPSNENKHTFERMKASTDRMVAIVKDMRQLQRSLIKSKNTIS